MRAFTSRIEQQPLMTVFIAALVIRMANLSLLQGHDAFFAEIDAITYWSLGARLAARETFWPTFLSMTEVMPLYPLLLAGVQIMFGDTPRIAALIQAVIDAGTCALIAALGAMVSPRTGLVAGVVAAMSATLIVYSTQILTDTLFLFFFAMMLLAGAHFLKTPTASCALLAGLAGGFSLATRPAVSLLLVAAIPVVFTASFARRRVFTPALAASVLFTIGSAVPISPVFLRNIFYYQSGNLTTQTSEYLAFWIVPLVTTRASGTPYQTSVDRMQALYHERLAERGLRAETNPFRLSAAKTELAREQMALLPLFAYVKSWAEGMVVNLGAPALLGDPRVRALPKPSFYNTPGVTLWDKTRAYIFDDPGLYQVLLILGLVSMIPFLALEAAGIFMLGRTLPWAAVFSGGVLSYFLMVSGPIASAKYRLPMEPVLIVLCAIPLAALFRKSSEAV